MVFLIYEVLILFIILKRRGEKEMNTVFFLSFILCFSYLTCL